MVEYLAEEGQSFFSGAENKAESWVNIKPEKMPKSPETQPNEC